MLTLGIIVSAFLLAHLAKWLEFYLLFTSISIKSMIDHARRTIKNGKVLREEVQKIVSRDTSKLNDYLLCSAVIESVAENFVDGVLSPLFYFSMFQRRSGTVLYILVNNRKLERRL